MMDVVYGPEHPTDNAFFVDTPYFKGYVAHNLTALQYLITSRYSDEYRDCATLIAFATREVHPNSPNNLPACPAITRAVLASLNDKQIATGLRDGSFRDAYDFCSRRYQKAIGQCKKIVKKGLRKHIVTHSFTIDDCDYEFYLAREWNSSGICINQNRRPRKIVPGAGMHSQGCVPFRTYAMIHRLVTGKRIEIDDILDVLYTEVKVDMI